MSDTHSGQLALILGFGLSLVIIWTSNADLHDLGWHRTLAFRACVLTAVSAKPLADLFPHQAKP